jgi:hypothetical protein
MDIQALIYDEIYPPDNGVELIAAGFFADDYQQLGARLFTITGDDVRVEDHFACIGAGAEAAVQSLHRREHEKFYDLETTLYHAYEAKRAAELSPNVGRYTYMVVLEPGEGGNHLRHCKLTNFTHEVE